MRYIVDDEITLDCDLITDGHKCIEANVVSDGYEIMNEKILAPFEGIIEKIIYRDIEWIDLN